MTLEVSDLEKTQKYLNEVSESFCLAKWTQVTLDLNRGTTASCHHPVQHRIPTAEIKKSFHRLHNTEFKLAQRRLMLEGKRPAECSYCWRVEDSGPGAYSDRIIKSSYQWSRSMGEKILQDPINEEFAPKMVEVNLGANCNFKCSYCSEEVSSSWADEIEKFGGYPTLHQHGRSFNQSLALNAEEKEIFARAFDDWFKSLSSQLSTLRVTGGEPLLNESFWRLLTHMKQRENGLFDFSINSNLGVSEPVWLRFLDELDILLLKKSSKEITIYTSNEALGERAEYIRFGLKHNLWIKRIEELMDRYPSLNLVVMSTYNALCVKGFEGFLQEILRLKMRRPHKPLRLDISLLEFPFHQRIEVLTDDFQQDLATQLEFVRAEMSSTKLFDFIEFEKMKRVITVFQERDRGANFTHKKDLIAFLREHDRRRGTDAHKVFPEFSSWLR